MVIEKSLFARADGFWPASVVIVQQAGTEPGHLRKRLKGQSHFGHRF
jgi:hypothetical protein